MLGEQIVDALAFQGKGCDIALKLAVVPLHGICRISDCQVELVPELDKRFVDGLEIGALCRILQLNITELVGRLCQFLPQSSKLLNSLVDPVVCAQIGEVAPQ